MDNLTSSIANKIASDFSAEPGTKRGFGLLVAGPDTDAISTIKEAALQAAQQAGRNTVELSGPASGHVADPGSTLVMDITAHDLSNAMGVLDTQNPQRVRARSGAWMPAEEIQDIAEKIKMLSLADTAVLVIDCNGEAGTVNRSLKSIAMALGEEKRCLGLDFGSVSFFLTDSPEATDSLPQMCSRAETVFWAEPAPTLEDSPMGKALAGRRQPLKTQDGPVI